MKTVNFTKVIGLMIWNMEKVHSYMQMARVMKANGLKTNKKDMELRYGPIDLHTKVTIEMEKRKEMVKWFGRMEAHMWANFIQIWFMGVVNTSGQMDGDILDNGDLTNCKDMENSTGQMDVNIEVNTNRT